MVEEKKTPEIVMTLGYTNGKELKGIPPKDRKSEDLKIDIMSQELLIEMQEKNEIMLLGRALAYSGKEQTIVEVAKRNGITDVPIGRTSGRDEGRE